MPGFTMCEFHAGQRHGEWVNGRWSYRNVPEAMLCGQVQRRVALIIVVWVAEPFRVVAYYALDQEDVVEDDASSQTRGSIDPGPLLVREHACYLG